MNASDASVEQKSIGKCLLDNWVEERATAVLDHELPREQIHKHGHKGILTMDPSLAVQFVSTVKSAFTPPKGPGVRQRGIRSELLEKYLLKQISEQTHAEFNPDPARTDYRSTTKQDFTVEGFQSSLPYPTKEHDHKSDQAITFWSENYHHIQRLLECMEEALGESLCSMRFALPPDKRKYNTFLKDTSHIPTLSSTFLDKKRVTDVRSRDTPFKKNATFSTPIGERLDDPALPTP